MHRIIVVFALLAALSACVTSDPNSPVAGNGEPRLTADAFVAADGAQLPLHAWLPEGPPKAVIVAVHGYNDYSNAFARPAKYLTDQGIAVYAYDQRGFGGAPGTGRWFGDAAMVDDFDTAVRLVSARYPDTPVYVMGESMGGAVVILAMTRPGAPHVAGTILVAPAVWARQRMTVIERAALWVFSRTVPWFQVNGGGLDIVPSDNTHMLHEMWRDPLVLKDSRVDTLDGLVDMMTKAYEAGPLLSGHVLYLYGEHDQIVPPKPSFDVMTQLAARPAAVSALYPQGYHMLLRDLGATAVLGDMVAWIGRPDAPLPSGADHRAATAISARRDNMQSASAKDPG